MTATPQTEADVLARLVEISDELERLGAQTYLLEIERQTLRMQLRPAASEGDEL